jgi:hypothetical protein
VTSVVFAQQFSQCWRNIKSCIKIIGHTNVLSVVQLSNESQVNFSDISAFDFEVYGQVFQFIFAELVRHQETHNEQMYECFICDKKFRSSLGKSF